MGASCNRITFTPARAANTVQALETVLSRKGLPSAVLNTKSTSFSGIPIMARIAACFSLCSANIKIDEGDSAIVRLFLADFGCVST